MKTLLISAFLFMVYYSFGCSCRQHSAKEALNSADIVFEGTLKKVSFVKIKSFNKEIYREKRIKVRRYKFLVSKVYKGDTTQRVQIVYSDFSLSSCGIALAEKEEYIVYSNNKNSLYWTTVCSRTTDKVEEERFCLNNIDIENCYCENITWRTECK